MALEKFDLATLTEFDGGRIRTAFEKLVDQMVDDCKDRPAVKKARIVTLTVSIVPVPNDEGDLDTVDLDFSFNERAPKRKSRTYNMIPGRKGLYVNEVSPDEARQRTLDEVAATKPRAVKGADEKKEVADAV